MMTPDKQAACQTSRLANCPVFPRKRRRRHPRRATGVRAIGRAIEQTIAQFPERGGDVSFQSSRGGQALRQIRGEQRRWAAWLLCLALPACSGSSPGESPLVSAPNVVVEGDPIAPIPDRIAPAGPKIRLGERLFAEPRLSGDGKVACRSCHLPDKGLADGLPRAKVEGRPEGAINVPTLYNASLLARYNWTGAFDSLERHNDALITKAEVMGSSWEGAARALSPDPEWRAAFAEVYPDGITPQNLRQALIAYERSLVSPRSRFDRYLSGEEAVLTDVEKAGYRLFREYGCISCHQGIGVGGNMFQKFGVMRDYFADRGDVKKADLGRFNVTGREEDMHVFRVPSLRNVALTSPYFHDGSASTLEDAVGVMARYQLGRSITPAQVQTIAAFLRTLTGERAEAGQ
jgi:cytochrome c peroxidase